MNDLLKQELLKLNDLDLDAKVEAFNEVRRFLKENSPFNYEPVDCVQWVKKEQVEANDYNPNSVAPKEMELLHISIQEDGYTQPIVVWEVEKGKYEVLKKISKRNLKEAVEIDGYQIFIPTNYSQFKACADLLNQCLLSGDYVGKMAKGKSLIVMVWKNGLPSSTAEINYDKSIRQFYGNEHDRNCCKPSDEEYKVLDTFLAGFQPKRIRKYLGA